MRRKKGQIFREMPPLAMIQSVHVERSGVKLAAQLITRSMYAGMLRDNQKTAPDTFYFYMDFENKPPGLLIYPTLEKQLTVRVRYLPKVVEI